MDYVWKRVTEPPKETCMDNTENTNSNDYFTSIFQDSLCLGSLHLPKVDGSLIANSATVQHRILCLKNTLPGFCVSFRLLLKRCSLSRHQKGVKRSQPLVWTFKTFFFLKTIQVDELDGSVGKGAKPPSLKTWVHFPCPIYSRSKRNDSHKLFFF